MLCVHFQKVKEIMAAVTIPVMAKARIGHFAEAQILQALGADMLDESEGEQNVYELYTSYTNLVVNDQNKPVDGQ